MEDASDAAEHEQADLPEARLERIEDALADLSRSVARLTEDRRRLRAIERGLHSLLRMQAVVPHELPYPYRLTAHRFGLRSQRGEDGVLAAIFDEVGVEHRRFVELGCGDNGGNSGFLASELGWTGLMVDGSLDRIASLRDEFSSRDVTVEQEWIRREDINDVVRRFQAEGETDLLSIDIDGNDIWVWEALTAVQARVACIEFNTILGHERSVAVPYDPDFVRDKSLLYGRYFGASLAAIESVGRRKGYRLVAVENVNAFFLHEGVGRHVPAVTGTRCLPPLREGRALHGSAR